MFNSCGLKTKKAKEILGVLKKVEKSEGYLVVISHRKKEVDEKNEEKEILHHQVFTQDYIKGDIMPSLGVWAKLLKPEIE